GCNHARRLELEIDQADSVGIAAADTDVGHHRHVALCTDVETIGTQAGGNLALADLHLAAVDAQLGDAVVSVARDERALSIWIEDHRARARFLATDGHLAGGGHGCAADGE